MTPIDKYGKVAYLEDVNGSKRLHMEKTVIE